MREEFEIEEVLFEENVSQENPEDLNLTPLEEIVQFLKKMLISLLSGMRACAMITKLHQAEQK